LLMMDSEKRDGGSCRYACRVESGWNILNDIETSFQDIRRKRTARP